MAAYLLNHNILENVTNSVYSINDIVIQPVTLQCNYAHQRESIHALFDLISNSLKMLWFGRSFYKKLKFS